MANHTLFAGKYRLVEEIASGAFGRVYRAEDISRPQTSVAIKLMQSTHLSSTQKRNTFLQEAQFLKMLKHPYILPVLEVGIESDVPYIVTEYAPNRSLRDRLQKIAPRPLPVPEVLTILAQIGQALQYAHAQNIIHRDLKPANILFNANGNALLADFGIATMQEDSIKYGTAIGTPFYMAPEQFRGSISKEGDQYALGCIAYELFTGRLPFNAPDFFALGFKHMSEVPLAPTQLNLLMPRSAEMAILKAMAKQRTDRHADIATFLSALGVATSPSSVAPPSFNSSTQEAESNDEDEDESEPDGEEDATVIRPLYSKKAAKRKSQEKEGATPLSSPHISFGKAISPADTLPRVVDEPLNSPRMPVLPQAIIMQRPAIIEEVAMVPTSHNGYAESPPVIPTLYPQNTYGNASTLPGQLPPQATVNVPPSMGQAAPSAHTHMPPFMPPIGQVAPPLNAQTPQGIFSANMNDNDDDLPNPAIVAGRGRRRRSKRNGLVGSILIAILLCLLIGGGVLYALSGFAHPNDKVRTTVTITPISNVNIGTTYTLYAVTGQPSSTNNQVQAREVTSNIAQQRVIPATGADFVPSSVSKGTLTFYNDSATPLTFAAGSIYTDLHGVQITNDVGGTVPAGNPDTTPPTWRAVTVPAHAVSPGQAGNIAKADINTWKTMGQKGSFVVQNNVAFTGGQDAQTYAILQQSDLTNATNSMEGTIYRDAQTALLAQVQPGEKLSGTPQCSSTVHFNHTAGERVAEAIASFSAQCSAEVYDMQAVHSLATALLQQKIATAHMSFQKPTNTFSITVLQADVVDAQGTIALRVDAEGLYVYQFSPAQKNTLASLVAGKSSQDAQALLLKQAGVNAVAIQITGGDGHTLPGDTSQITILILRI